MLKTKRNKILGFFGVLIAIFILVVLLYRPVIFQEGNPMPLVNGIMRLNFTQDKIVVLNMDGDRYLTKSNNGQEVIKSYMQDKGYAFTEQMGSGYFFKSLTEQSAVATHKYYSRFYSLWNITENTNNLDNLEDDDNLWETTTTGDDITFQYPKEISIAEELKDCLPKSDTASHEKCNELLATIRNFDDCVKAGFSIMKSNPPQCTSPDDRTFIDETNSTWDAVLEALNNCEVHSVFQTHSKLVTLNLKNGSELTAYEPKIDDVMDVVDGLNGGCGDVRMATE